MIIILFLALQLVQANDFTSFRVCYLDTNAHPWEFRPHPEGHEFNLRRDQIVYVEDPTLNAAGIECARVCTAQGCKFVVGSVASVMRILKGSENASPESR